MTLSGELNILEKTLKETGYSSGFIDKYSKGIQPNKESYICAKEERVHPIAIQR